jgi:hypothetical protein
MVAGWLAGWQPPTNSSNKNNDDYTDDGEHVAQGSQLQQAGLLLSRLRRGSRVAPSQRRIRRAPKLTTQGSDEPKGNSARDAASSTTTSLINKTRVMNSRVRSSSPPGRRLQPTAGAVAADCVSHQSLFCSQRDRIDEQLNNADYFIEKTRNY